MSCEMPRYHGRRAPERRPSRSTIASSKRDRMVSPLVHPIATFSARIGKVWKAPRLMIADRDQPVAGQHEGDRRHDWIVAVGLGRQRRRHEIGAVLAIERRSKSRSPPFLLGWNADADPRLDLGFLFLVSRRSAKRPRRDWRQAVDEAQSVIVHDECLDHRRSPLCRARARRRDAVSGLRAVFS